MQRFVNAFIMAISAVFETSAFVGFFAVSFIVFSFCTFMKLLYDLTGGAKNGD